MGTAATRREFAGSTVVGHVDTKSHNHAAETSTIPPSERGRPSSVVIAGAGIIGLTTAWRLRRRGIEVTVLDDAPVSGASFAAAGMLAPVSEVIWISRPSTPHGGIGPDLSRLRCRHSPRRWPRHRVSGKLHLRLRWRFRRPPDPQ
ncbi:glycine oxidase ThiO [Cutibacterium acnes JCM 18916]|nr:glycine oxidase ThiO [Cutibacterium acnes JCM 18916]